MFLTWSSCLFSFALINFFIKYMPGDIYINVMLSGLSACSLLIESEIIGFIDIKKLQVFSLLIIFASSVCLSMFEKDTQYEFLFASLLLVAKIGTNMTLGCCYSIHSDLFPTYFMTNSFGICNFFSRSITALAPLMAEMSNRKIPFMTMVLLSFLAMVASMFLVKKNTP